VGKDSNDTNRKSGHFFKRKEVWLPTWKTWLLFLICVFSFTILFVKTVPFFLAPTQSVNARVLIVEGWIDEDALEFAVALQKTNQYDLVLTSGGRVEKGFYESEYGTFANLGAIRLKKIGYPGTNIVAVAPSDAPRDRTYHSAQAIRAYLEKTPYRSLDLLSTSVHSRRSWLLYRRALGPKFKVGVYAAPSREFDMKGWFRKSSGVRTVISEIIAYLYARFLFSPQAFESPPELNSSPTNPTPPPAVAPR
jgi:hypothetical protein